MNVEDTFEDVGFISTPDRSRYRSLVLWVAVVWP